MTEVVSERICVAGATGYLGARVVATKEQAVDPIGDARRSAGIAFTIIRPTAYFGDLTNRAFDSVRKNGRYSVIGAESHRINPIHGNDVAAILAESVNDPGQASREHKVGDPDVFTFREID